MSREALAHAYTTIASDYDRMVEGDAWMRRILWDRYLHLFQPGQHVLDVACGTGLDTIFLAQHGLHVTGIDVAPGMIAQLKTKIAQDHLIDRVTARILAIEDLAALPPERFDGILSAFAGLNTIPDPGVFAAEAARLLRPGGRLMVHMMNRFSLWEGLMLLRRGRLRAAMRLPRQTERTFTIGGRPVLHYLSFAQPTFRQHFAAYFTLDRCYSLGCVRPPHDMTWISDRMVKRLATLEQHLRARWPFTTCGRFFILEMTRRVNVINQT